MRALILVDIQNDFLPGGALAVPHGDEVILVANQLIAKKDQFFDMIIATQDWHPTDHGSFASNNPGTKIGQFSKLNGLDQIMWPDHCVQGKLGSEFASKLDMKKVDRIFQKGTDPAIDSYSGFFDNARRKSTGLGEFLKEKGVTEVVVLGLATDYCVKFTALDAKSLGFDTIFIENGSRAVNLQPDDEKKSIAELSKAGVEVMTSSEFFKKNL